MKDSIKLAKAAETLMKYLRENHHPHVTAVVTGEDVVLEEGLLAANKELSHTFKPKEFGGDECEVCGGDFRGHINIHEQN